MPSFSKRSAYELSTCAPELQRLFCAVIENYDCTVLKGHRGEAAQNEAFRTGASTKEWPDSKHNLQPSIAVDVVAFPIDWNDTERHYHFAGYVMGVARSMGIKIRWGGDWDDDQDLHDQQLYDLVHFELAGGSDADA